MLVSSESYVRADGRYELTDAYFLDHKDRKCFFDPLFLNLMLDRAYDSRCCIEARSFAFRQTL
jgi:hypothetical protein